MLQHKVVGNLHGCLPLLVVYFVKHLISRRKGHDFGAGLDSCGVFIPSSAGKRSCHAGLRAD